MYKQANEGNARVYWLDSGLPSVGLRPMTVYGVGRDQGMTSGPTKAIVAAVLGRAVPRVVQRSDAVPVRGGCGADPRRGEPDRTGEGANVFNLPGAVADGRRSGRGDRDGRAGRRPA